MTYTSMLFALTFDKFIFGQTPGVWSIIGSTLILGSAIYMAIQRDSSSIAVDGNESAAGGVERNGRFGDEEEGVGLIGAMEGEIEGAVVAVQDVEMRNLG